MDNSRRGDGRAVLPNGQDAANDWQIGQGGVRLDGNASRADLITRARDSIKVGSPGEPNEPVATGTNIVGRWSHAINRNSDFRLQVYSTALIGTFRLSYDDVLDTYDVDFQHRRLSTDGRPICWGATTV